MNPSRLAHRSIHVSSIGPASAMDVPNPASVPETSDLDNMAKALVQRLLASFACEVPQSSVSESIYNTAWVSMIPSPPTVVGYWLFPQAFKFIAGRQLQSGGWSSFETLAEQILWETDGIINTMACLLALLVRQDSGAEVPDDLGKRILRADGSLRQMLQSWDLDSSDNAGFEVLIPAHLVMLGKYGLHYEFPARPRLMSLYEQKMEKIKPESVYGKDLSTSLYCLEGMIGKVDFDLVAHHKLYGSMLGNPASTAAYLMNTSAWDVDAEAYLRRAMASGGAVEIHPSNLFEITWVSGTEPLSSISGDNGRP